MQLFEIVYVDDGVDVVQKRSVRVHRAQRRRQQHKEETAALSRAKNIDLSDHKNRTLLGRIKLWLE